MFKKFLAVLVMLYATLALAAVDVNKATEAQLDAVKGIGPVTSKMIMSERKKGDFKNWDDFIERIKGVGDTRAARLSGEGLTVNGAAYKVATKDTRSTKEDRKETKASAKEDKKEAKAAAKEEKKDAKEARKDDKVAVTRPAANAATPAAKPAASAPKK